MTERPPWENQLWPVEPIWRGRTVFICASGPSMTPAVAERLRGQTVMVINSTYKLVPWADVWYFTDNVVFERNREAVAAWPGHVITMSRQAKREMPEKVKRIKGGWGPVFLDGRNGEIRIGRSSGHTGISLAAALGATCAVLCGFDMRMVDGREHHHDDYAGQPRDLDIYQREFVPAFAATHNAPGWNEAALAYGMTILNATPDSALTEFPMVCLDEVLCREAA